MRVFRLTLSLALRRPPLPEDDAAECDRQTDSVREAEEKTRVKMIISDAVPDISGGS